LEPIGMSRSCSSRSSAAVSTACGGITRFETGAPPGGCAATMLLSMAPALAWMAFSSPMRSMSASVSGRTQAALRHAVGKLAAGVSFRYRL
jgi:hypothetical protein